MLGEDNAREHPREDILGGQLRELADEIVRANTKILAFAERDRRLMAGILRREQTIAERDDRIRDLKEQLSGLKAQRRCSQTITTEGAYRDAQLERDYLLIEILEEVQRELGAMAERLEALQLREGEALQLRESNVRGLTGESGRQAKQGFNLTRFLPEGVRGTDVPPVILKLKRSYWRLLKKMER